MIRKVISESDIANQIAQNVNSIIEKLKDELIRAGEMCLENMQSQQGYKDQSGNLTASKGYAVAMNGEIVHISNFDSSIGGAAGRELATEKARQSRGLSLVVVAGMQYAIYVEAKGHNVITSSKLLAEDIVPQILSQLGLK